MKRLVVAAVLATSVCIPAVIQTVMAAEQKAEAGEVTNEQMVDYYQKGKIGKGIWVIDSRPTAKYVTGHIPGAIGLPLDALKKDPATLGKLGIAQGDPLVFYCAGRECTLSVDAAEMARKMGFAKASVYRNGVPGWNQKMQPLQAEAPFIEKGNVILVDTAVGKETIVTPANKTIQLSLKDLKGAMGQKLLAGLSKNAPLVVIERGDMDGTAAVLEELRDMDFRRLSYFPINDWKGKLAAAPTVGSLTWAPVYGPGQVSPKAFEAAVASGKFIVDVRPTADFARGHFKGAVNIPVESLEKDFVQVPKDKEVFVNCATGAKSQKAFDILGRKGYSNVKYLDAEISCKGETCTIKE